MVSTEIELPCPKCGYDLRGLESGACPECGAAFPVVDLKPETPGLAAERRLSEARSLAGVATLPLRMAVAPRRAFQRQCRLTRILTDDPWRILLWCAIWFLALVLLAVSVRYGLDRIRGMIMFVGSYWHPHHATRFGSLPFAPLHLVIAWFECAFVAFVAMVVSSRWIDVKQFLRLTIWLLPFTLPAAVLSILYHAAYYHVLYGMLERLCYSTGSTLASYAQGWAQALTVRVFDLAFGLLAGIAAATVFKRNRWLIPPLTAVLLVIAYPVFFETQLAFARTVYNPIVESIYGPPQRRMVPPRLFLRPTFTVGRTAPELAGRWHLAYESETPKMAGELTIDANGKLVLFEQHSVQSGDSGTYVGDGLVHEVEYEETGDHAAHISYVLHSGCECMGSDVSINVRIEFGIERKRGAVTELITYIHEEKFAGVLNEDGSVITGSSRLRQDCAAVPIDPTAVERDFVMRRLTGSSQPTTDASDEEPRQ